MSNKNVFISYARADALELSEKLYRWLSDELRALPFWDKEDLKPGDDWKYEIDTAIEECAFLLLILTPGALKSQHVTYEWAYALGQRKLVIPLQVDKRITEKKLHPKLAELQYIPFINPTQEDWDLLKEKLQSRLSETFVPPEVLAAIDMLNSPLPSNREQAIKSLEQMEIQSADKALKDAISHNHPHVRALAGISYTRRTNCQDMDSIPGLAQALKFFGYSDDNFGTTLDLLYKMNNQQAVKCLYDAIEVKSFYSGKTKDEKIVQTLLAITDPSVVPTLKSLGNQENGFSPLALKKLMDFKDEEILPEIVKIISSPETNFNSRADLLSALDLYDKNPDVIEAIWRIVVKHQVHYDRSASQIFEQALKSLKKTGDATVIEKLYNLAQSKQINDTVKRQLIMSVREMQQNSN